MANIKLGRTGISGLKLGTHNVGKVFKGNAQIWPAYIEQHSIDFTTGVLDPRISYSGFGDNYEFVQGGITPKADSSFQNVLLGHNYDDTAGNLYKVEYSFNFKWVGQQSSSYNALMTGELWSAPSGGGVETVEGGIRGSGDISPSSTLYASVEQGVSEIATYITTGQSYTLSVAMRFTGTNKQVYTSMNGTAVTRPFSSDYITGRNIGVYFKFGQNVVLSHMDVTLYYGAA